MALKRAIWVNESYLVEIIFFLVAGPAAGHVLDELLHGCQIPHVGWMGNDPQLKATIPDDVEQHANCHLPLLHALNKFEDAPPGSVSLMVESNEQGDVAVLIPNVTFVDE